MAAQAGLCMAWSETPEDTFCRVVAHLMIVEASLLRYVMIDWATLKRKNRKIANKLSVHRLTVHKVASDNKSMKEFSTTEL